MEHRYILMPYKGMSSRVECPNCGKKEFVQYIDSESNEVLDSTCGRCNREVECGYHYPPKDYFKDHPTKEYGSVSYRYDRYDRTKVIRPTSTPKHYDAIRYDVMAQSVNDTLSGDTTSTFTEWLKMQTDTTTQWEQVISSYHLGATSNNEVIFWQVDYSGVVRTGQILSHKVVEGCNDCKRNHQYMNWVHSKMIKEGSISDNFSMSQCLYGEHLLGEDPNKVVALVEGQKSAILGAIANPQWVWTATCGKQGLKPDRLQALKGRSVIVIPDLDAHSDWSIKLPDLAKQVGFRYSIYEGLTKIASEDDFAHKRDIADYLLRNFTIQ